MIAAHSTVPRWQAEPPGVDPGGRSYGVLWFGSVAAQVAYRWVRAIAEMSAPVWAFDGGDGGAETFAELAMRLAACHTGLRLMVAGPEQEVLTAQVAAREAGMIDAELALHVTSQPSRLVYCVHCKTTGSYQAAVGEIAPCAGCDRPLLIFAHFSRRSGSYLGFLADAEELA